MDLKALPHNLSSERELLGNLIQNNDLILDAIQILKPTDFYNEGHKKIYGAITELFKNNSEIDIVTLASKLGETLKYTGGMTYITELYNSAMGRGVKSHIDIIKDCSTRRNIIKQSQLMMQQAFEVETKTKDIVNNFTNSMLDISTEGTKIMTAAEMMEKTLSFVEANYNRGGGIIGMECGLKTIDSATDGFIKKDLVVIAGRPSMGKTALVTTICEGLSKHNKVAIFELEMSEESLGTRMLASKSMINSVKLKRGDLEAKEWSNVTSSASNLATRQLWIDTNPSQTIYDIKAKAKRLKMQNGLDCIVVDHIGLLNGTDKNKERNLQIGEITRQGKIIAKELDLCVIILCQLSRAPEQRADHRPVMSDLGESGKIEQDADLILLLYRDEYYNLETEEKHILEAIIGKQRNGKTGTLKLYCDLGIQVIADLDYIKR